MLRCFRKGIHHVLLEARCGIISGFRQRAQYFLYLHDLLDMVVELSRQIFHLPVGLQVMVRECFDASAGHGTEESHSNVLGNAGSTDCPVIRWMPCDTPGIARPLGAPHAAVEVGGLSAKTICHSFRTRNVDEPPFKGESLHGIVE